jgi:RNA polymerase sigma-70 factor (ECF subfamily)
MPAELHALPDSDTALPRAEEQTLRLMAQIGRGDRLAFDTLYDLWAPTLLGIAARMLGNHQEAEVAVRDTFVKIWHRAADFDCGRVKPFVWCFTILRGVCIEMLRQQNRQKLGVARNAAAGLLTPANPIPEAMILPPDSLRSARRALDQLPLDERRCLELAVFLEYAQTQPLNSLDTEIDRSKERLQNALETLHTTMKSHET